MRGLGTILLLLFALPALASPFAVAHFFARQGALTSRECPEEPFGGIVAQTEALRVARRAGPFVLVESGTFAPDAGDAESVVQALKDLGVAALSPGAADARLGAPRLRAIAQRIPLVSASLQIGGESVLPAARRLGADKRWCFVGVAEPSALATTGDITVLPPEQAVKRGLAACGKAIPIVLSDLERQTVLRLATQFPAVRLWLGGYERFDDYPQDLPLGKASRFVSGRARGQQMARITFDGRDRVSKVTVASVREPAVPAKLPRAPSIAGREKRALRRGEE